MRRSPRHSTELLASTSTFTATTTTTTTTIKSETQGTVGIVHFAGSTHGDAQVSLSISIGIFFDTCGAVVALYAHIHTYTTKSATIPSNTNMCANHIYAHIY